MEVENLGESVQAAGGTEAPPSAEVSTEPEVKPTSLEAESPQEAVDERINRLEAQFRSLQGDKDRGTNRALNGVDKLSARFDELEKYAKMRTDGKSAEQARREMVLDEVVQERMGTQVVQEPVGSQAVEPSGFNADEFLRGQGIDPNSAEALELIRQDNTNVMDYFILALGQKTKPVQAPNVAQVMPAGSGTGIDGRTLEVVGEELNAAMTNEKGIDLDLVAKLEKEHLALVPKQ